MSPLPVSIEDSYLAIVPSLKASFPAFSLSREYAVVDGNDDLPGVILAAFARYLIALSTDGAGSPELSRGIATINSLYRSTDPRVQAAICDEFIEAFDGAASVVMRIRPLFSQQLGEAFARVLQ